MEKENIKTKKLTSPWSLKAAAEMVKQAAIQWNDDNALRLGAAVSYYTVFSLGPLLVLSVGIAAICFGDKAARGQLAGQMVQLVGSEGAHAIEAIVASSSRQSSGLLASIVSIVILVIGSTGVFTELKSDL